MVPSQGPPILWIPTRYGDRWVSAALRLQARKAGYPLPQRSLLRDIPAEDILAQASADGHVIVVTNDALTVASHDRLRLDVPIEEVRRIQFDIERERPATLVIVPDAPSSEPQVIMVQPDEYERVGHALAVLGMKMATMAD